MSRSNRRYWALAFFLVTLNLVAILWVREELRVSARESLEIVAVSPKGDPGQADRLTFVFDQPVVEDGDVRLPLVESPLRLEPDVEGRWMWATRDRLEYRLAHPLAPGRVFEVAKSESFESLTGRELRGQSSFQFRTAALELEAVTLESVDATQAFLEFDFNQAVSVEPFLRHLTLTDQSGRTLEAEVPVRDPAPSVVLAVVREGVRELHWALGSGLVGAGGELGLERKVQGEVSLPEAFAFLRAEVTTPRVHRRASIHLVFSEALDSTCEAPGITVRPPVADLRSRVRRRGIRLEGSFQPGRRYEISCEPVVMSHAGETLSERVFAQVEIPDLSPSLGFMFEHGVLMPSGHLALDLRATNIEAVDVDVHRVHANNLVSYLRGESRDATSRQLVERRVALDAPRNEVADIALDLRELIADPLGIYCVSAHSATNSFRHDTAWVTVSDLGLTVKRVRDGYVVWATSLKEGTPLSGVTVSGLSFNNQLLGGAQTGADGTCRLPIPSDHPDGPVFVIVAQKDGDLSFVRAGEREWMIDAVDQSGRSRALPLEAHLYSERGVYRPGDTVHLTGALRDDQGHVPNPFPLRVVVARPDGRVVHEETVTPGDQGLFQLSLSTEGWERTGPYRLTAHIPGDDVALGETTVLVEEFVPARLELNVAFEPDAASSLKVHSRYLFGRPAAELPVSVRGDYHPVRFSSEAYPGFQFGPSTLPSSPNFESLEGTLNDEGRLNLDVIPPPAHPDALWKGEFEVTVREAFGRSISQRCSQVFDDTLARMGIKLGREATRKSSPWTMDWVRLLDPQALADESDFQVDILRREREWHLEEVEGRAVWRRVETRIPVSTTSVQKESGRGRFEFPTLTSGLYRVVVKDNQSGALAEVDFVSEATLGASLDLADLGEPSRLDLNWDKSTYRPGESARLTVRSAFDGLLWLTLETDDIVFSKTLAVEDRHVEVDIPVPDDLRGGAFVAASLIRPIDPNATTWMPHRAQGLLRLHTEHPSRTIPLTLQAPDRAEPGSTIDVQVQAECAVGPGENPWVHVWAVDEGILMASDYATPDPYGFFLADRRAAVATADTFFDLLPDHMRPASTRHIGGDEYRDPRSLRSRAPRPTARRGAGVVFTEIRPLDDDGRATVSLPMPELRGEMRVMATVFDRDAYGATEIPLTLDKPLMLQASWPRFVSPGDSFWVPVAITHDSGHDLEVTARVTVQGPLHVQGTSYAIPLVVPAERTTHFELQASADQVGVASVVLHLEAITAEGEVLRERVAHTLNVRAPTLPQARTTRLLFEAGEAQRIERDPRYIEGTVETRMHIGGRPDVQLGDAIQGLIDYPYGCLEQTTSRLYGLLAARLVEDGRSTARVAAIDRRLRAGMIRLEAMQEIHGGLGYWPGSKASAWGSTYAAGCLAALRDQGVEVRPRLIDPLLAYLSGLLQGGGGKELSDNVRAQICDVLASFDRPHVGWMRRLSERRESLDLAGRAHLASAWLGFGDRARAFEVLGEDSLTRAGQASMSGRITTKTHQEALLLLTLLELDRNHVWIPDLVRCLQQRRQESGWRNTLESATALRALSAYLKDGTDSGVFEGELTWEGGGTSFDSSSLVSFETTNEGPFTLETQGSGDVYVSLLRQGIPREEPLDREDRGLVVRRHWFDENGNELEARHPTLHIGDLVYVDVTLRRKGGADIDNVVITDFLPGGLEVENPRLATSALGALPVGDRAEHVDFRDDRVSLFADAREREQTFRFALRAITSGRFHLPPIHAIAMYDPQYVSVHGGGRVEVHP